MAQTLTLKRNIRTKPKPAIIKMRIADWDSYLYKIWLDKMDLYSGLYDDQIQHGWSCKCSSRTIFYVEEKKRK